jgi:hypothetical protein
MLQQGASKGGPNLNEDLKPQNTNRAWQIKYVLKNRHNVENAIGPQNGISVQNTSDT